ncbi:MAG: lysylphosphatidylglycerol synthase transmembrane domain-containing protein, partial [Anaerolineales bacterium]
AVVIAGFISLFFMVARPQWALSVAKSLTRPWPKLQTWLSEQLSQFLEGLAPLREPSRFIRIAFWMLLTWLFNVAWYYALMRSFLPEATWLWAFFSIAATSLGVAVPSSPGYIGVFEAAMVLSLAPFGVDPAIALAYALTAHVIYFVMTAVLGIIGFWQQGQSLSSIYNQLLSRSAAK